MSLVNAAYLLDVNALIALILGDHPQNGLISNWFDESGGLNWGTCAITQTGFIRLMANPKVGGYSVTESTHLLGLMIQHPGHSTWPINEGWASVTSPFEDRLFGHQQVTDAYLLGLAVQANGILVTLDRGIRYLAAEPYSRNLVVLEP